jgi:uncharacterized membrane protein HdeD (DUF308 family)
MACLLLLLCLRSLLSLQGYDTFIVVFYILAAFIVLTTVLTVWVALIVRKNQATNAWMKR